MWAHLKTKLGEALARYLQKQTGRYVAFNIVPQERLRKHLRPGDVLLVEGNLRISTAIKYLTRSTWSHAALYIGPGNPKGELIEADLQEGVRYHPLAAYEDLNTRICRPVGLTEEDLETVLKFAADSVGRTYDLKNVVDLVRYLLPEPPVPARWRRRMLALGSGDPTRAICSTLIAEAFQAVRYPILPLIEPGCDRGRETEILRIRHHSLFTPRDFDLSPYFRVVKPTLEERFDYRSLNWVESDPDPEAPGDPGTGPDTRPPA